MGTIWTVPHDLHDVAVRLVAVEKNGEQHLPAAHSSAGVKDFVLIAVEFPLPPEQIREFKVQTRSYEAVEIPGVALAARTSN
jgi:hypothetical protein